MTRMKKDLIPVVISSLITIIFFLLPVGISVKKSFFTFGGEFIGLDNYIMTFESQPFQDALAYTTKITIISIAVVMVSSVILAMAIRRTFIGKKLTLFLLQFDVAMPSITCASMMLIVMSQTGFTSSLFYNLGILTDYSNFPNVFSGSQGYGVILTIVWMFIPYIALSLLAVLHSISNDQEDQAATLGVRKIKRFFYITLPSLKSSIAYTSVLCFACVFGSYELPSLLGSRHTLVTLAYHYYNDTVMTMPEYMQSYTISIILFVITSVVSGILMYYSLLAGRNQQ